MEERCSHQQPVGFCLNRLRKALTRTKRQRNMAVGECNNRKLEVDILKSTSRALEVCGLRA